MKHKGPILTLAAGLVLAAVLMVLNLRVTADSPQNTAGEQPEATTGPAAEAPPPTTAPPTEAPAAPAVTYAGRVNGGAATIAIAVKAGKAIAYLCDGKRTEAWLQGTARNGELVLSGAGNARLTGTFGNGVAEGNVNAAGRRFTFSVKVVKPPSGIYRATANVRNAEIVAGWVVTEDGEQQTGVMTVKGEPRPAEPLNLENNTTVVNDTTITANQVDPSAGL